MEKDEKLDMIKSLLYALNCNIKDETTKHLVIDDFLASMNRKGILSNDDVRELLRYAKENWQYPYVLAYY